MKNLFFELLDVDKVKKAIGTCPVNEIVILLPNYSINIQSVYNNSDSDDPDCLFNDWDDFESEIGISMQVNDFDDLIVDPHGLMYS